MPDKPTLVFLSVLVVLATGIATCYLETEQLSAYGSIFAGAGSILAVIWFTGSLWYQSQQIVEQRGQFSEEFKHLREDGLAKRAAVISRNPHYNGTNCVGVR
jgi:hypothetical protein